MDSDIEQEFVVTLGLVDIKKLWKQAKKSPEKQTRFIVKIPKGIKTIAYDETKGVKGPVGISSDSETPETSLD